MPTIDRKDRPCGESSPAMSRNPKRPAPKSPRRRKPPLRITRVYTRRGDRGETELVGGRKVPKHDRRIAAYGAVDELSVAMGQARQSVSVAAQATPAGGSDIPHLDRHLRYIQNLLFTLGGELATRHEDRWKEMPVIVKANVTYLEELIDAYNSSLPPLTDFVLPGGGGAALALHSCRVICRRAEREASALAEREALGARVLPFLNRLSDLFFVLARWIAAPCRAEGAANGEAIWDRKLKQPPIAPPRRKG